MRISEETMENFSVSYPLERLAPVERILFIDIETTGFAARSSYLYLIGEGHPERLSGVCKALPLYGSFQRQQL